MIVTNILFSLNGRIFTASSEFDIASQAFFLQCRPKSEQAPVSRALKVGKSAGLNRTDTLRT